MWITDVHEVLTGYVERRQQCGVLGNRRGERLSREEIRRRTLEKFFVDPVFREQLLTRTLVLMAIILDECLGIDRREFVHAIQSYPVLHETPERLYLEIPSCHRGCLLPGTLPHDHEKSASCSICERAFPLSPGSEFVMPGARPFEAMTRRKIEGLIQKRLSWDPKFAQELMADPLETYIAYATHLCSGKTPQYLTDVHELQLVHESNSEMFFILPTQERFALEHIC